MRLIDADELKNNAYHAYPSIDHYCLSKAVIDLSDIEKAPTIEAEPIRHGHWETIRNAYGETEGFIHAECGRCSNSKDNYCPNCGAKMDECNTDGFVDDDECRECEYGLAILALEKAEKYRWHDLRKDLKDLPDELFSKSYLVMTDCGYAISKFYGYGEEAQCFREFPYGVWEVYGYGMDVIAWKYIEESEE